MTAPLRTRRTTPKPPGRPASLPQTDPAPTDPEHSTQPPGEAMEYTHQSVRDYVEAKKRGDTKTTDRIVAEVKARFATRTTDGSEAAQLLHATMHVQLGQPS